MVKHFSQDAHVKLYRATVITIHNGGPSNVDLDYQEEVRVLSAVEQSIHVCTEVAANCARCAWDHNA